MTLPCQGVFAHVRVGQVSAIVIGPAIEVILLDVVQFAGGEIVSQQVAAIVRGIELATPGRPVETDAIAQAGGDRFSVAAVQFETHYGGASGIPLLTDIAGRALSQVELVVRADADCLTPVVAIVSQALDDRLVFSSQLASTAVKEHTADAVGFRDIEPVIVDSHTQRST